MGKDQHKDYEVYYLFIEDEKSILYNVTLNCIGFHPFHYRFQTLYAPDYAIIDLDLEAICLDQVISCPRISCYLVKNFS